MKKIFQILAILFLMESSSSFLDSPGGLNDPNHLWNGQAWYCVDHSTIPATIIAGPFATPPDCRAY